MVVITVGDNKIYNSIRNDKDFVFPHIYIWYFKVGPDNSA